MVKLSTLVSDWPHNGGKTLDLGRRLADRGGELGHTAVVKLSTLVLGLVNAYVLTPTLDFCSFYAFLYDLFGFVQDLVNAYLLTHTLDFCSV